MKTGYIPIIIFTVFSLLTFYVNSAYAYLDPGTGSMVVQAVIAGVAAVSVSIGIFWRRLSAFFSGLFGRKNDGGNDLNDS